MQLFIDGVGADISVNVIASDRRLYTKAASTTIASVDDPFFPHVQSRLRIYMYSMHCTGAW